MSNKETCYLCGEKELRIIRTKLRHAIIRNVLECKKCGIVYLEPVQQDLKDFYTEDYRKLYSPVIGRALSSQELFDTCLPYQENRINELKHVLGPTEKLLDVGCASGAFLHAVKSHVLECIDMEFNLDNAHFVNEILGIKVYTERIEEVDLPQEYFDIATAFQVLEHVDDPLKFLARIHKLLKPGGVICIEVPNVQDVLLSVYKIEPYADFWFKEPHVFNYSIIPQRLSLWFLRRRDLLGEQKLSNHTIL